MGKLWELVECKESGLERLVGVYRDQIEVKVKGWNDDLRETRNFSRSRISQSC